MENLFDPSRDARFARKAEQVARVIANIGRWDTPALVGLCEVENAHCVARICYAMPNHGYRFIHFDSPDERGIDVALLYDPQQFMPLDSMPLRVDLQDDKTRDILFVKGLTLNAQQADTLYLFVCHLPSMAGGEAETEWKRQAAKKIVQQRVDSLLALNSQARIVVMGDMNSGPQNDLRGLTNRMIGLEASHQGTYCYQGVWSCLDQFYLSPSLVAAARVSIFSPNWLLIEDYKYLVRKPRRMFNGPRYDQDGYSDHLPIVLTLP